MSLAGIGTTTELVYVNSIGKDLMTSGRFNTGENVRGTSFAKTFDLVGYGGGNDTDSPIPVVLLYYP